MKKMVLLMALSLVLTSCASAAGAETILPDKTAQELILEIYDRKDPGLAVGEMEVDLTNLDSVNYYTGLSSAEEIKDVAVSETMIGAQAYSLVLLRVKDPMKSEEVAKAMLQGIDPRKWICVGADDVKVAVRGDLVLLVMVSSEFADLVRSEEIIDAWKDVVGGTLDLELKK